MSDYKLVPVEPTPEMMKAFCVASKAVTTEEWEDPLYDDQVADVLKNMPPAYRSMLAAAPAVQGESVSHDWDDQDKCRRCGDRDWYASSTCTPKQQPAPDVTALVEALEKARDAIASLPKDALGNVPDTQQCQGWHIRDELINYISTALAVHRKGDQP